MPATDPFKRYLDAGLEFTDMTRKRAESIVKELVKAGEVQREHAQQRVDELLERSRQASNAFAEAVRTEVTRQLTDLGLVQAPKKAAATAKKTAGQTAGAATKAAKATAKKTTATAKKSAATAKKTASAAKKTAKKATGAS
jgi:DNA-binding protein HU-beta